MSMTRSKIEQARASAIELLSACDAAVARLNKELERSWLPPEQRIPTPSDHSFGSAETGALRRKSMDLTRTLAELRK